MPTAPGKQCVPRIRGVIWGFTVVVSAVKSQGHPESCRAFSATQSLESQLVLTSSTCTSYVAVTCSVSPRLRSFGNLDFLLYGFTDLFPFAALCMVLQWYMLMRQSTELGDFHVFLREG